MTDTDRLPPHSRESERALLGSLLRDPHALADAVLLIRADDFYVFGHQKIFETAATLADKGKPVDVVTIAEALTKQKLMEDIGGHGYLIELWDAAPSAAHCRQYAATIREYAVRRRLIQTCGELSASAYDLGEPSEQLLDQAERSILDIAERSLVNTTQTLQEAMQGAYRVMDDRKRSKAEGRDTGVSTGFIDLDSMTGGLQNSELCLLAARPSVGKTSLGLRIAIEAANVRREPTLFVSLEQSSEALMERALCMEAHVDSMKCRRGHLSHEEISRLMQAGGDMESAPLFVDATRGQNMLRIAANARRTHRRHGLRLLVIDYLQLIEPDDRRKPEHEQITGISRRLTHLAGELKIPVLALCQLNRESESGQGRRPKLSDLRGSGSLEQDADIVMLMSKDQGIGQIIVDVAKNRNGQTGDVMLMFDRQYFRFENFATEMQGGRW